MAADKLVDSSQLDGALKATADEIRRYNNEADTVKKDWDMDTGFAEIVAHMTDSDSPAAAGTILSGKEAYVNQTKVTGTIESDAGATLYATTSNQTLAVSGKYMTGNVIVSKLTASNFAKENIKYNTTIKVNNGKADVYSVKGTFTQTPSGKRALTADALRSDYSGFINGQQVDGTMPNSSVSQGNTTVSGTTATRGTATWGTGYITSGSIGAATFANQATSGQTYVDISSTTSAPVLISGDCLYINKGYTDNLKISLAKLVPDLSSAGADISSPSMLNGYTAYNNEGKIITGNIQNLAAEDITVNGPTVTIPLEKYTGASGATKVTKTIASGEYNADSSASSNSEVTPSLGLDSTASTKYGFTTTKPSGTTGTNFLTVNPNASATAWSVTPRANITKAGYLDIGNKTGTAVTGTPTVNDGTDYYVPVQTVSFSGGTVSATAFTKNDLALTLQADATDATTTNISNYTFGNKDATNYPFFVKIDASTPSVSGTTNVSVTKREYDVSAGVIAAVSKGTARAAISQNANVSVNATSGTKYLGIKSAAIKGTSTNATATTTVAPGTVSVAKSTVATGVTDAADSASVTTTTPSSGVYVAVQATAAANSTGTTSSITGSGSATVTSAGYASTSLTGSVTVSGTATAKTSEKKSSVTYVKIKSGAGEANSANVVRFDTDGSNAGVNIKDVIGTGSTTEPTTGYYAAFTGSGSSKISTGGWLAANTELPTASKTVYFPVTTAKVTHSGGGLTVNSNYSATPTITMEMTQSPDGFAIQDSAPVSGYYLTIGSETNKMTGTTKVTRAEYTELWEKGYLPDKAQWPVLASASKSPTVTVEKATKTRYVTIPSGKITNNTSGGSSTDTIERGKQIKIAKGYYNEDLYYTARANSGTLTISEYGNTKCDGFYTVSVPQGVITNNTSGGTSSGTINRGSQIKIGKGFYNADLYYTAQANSGTLTITTNHDAHTNISCDGKLNVNVQGITVPMNQPFTLVSAADSALNSTSDITITNGAYRNLVLTNAAQGTAEITNNGTISSLTNGGTISEITNESSISNIINDGTVKITNSSKTTGCGNLTVQAYATSGATSVTSKLITQNGLWVSTTASAATTYYGKVTVPSGTQGKPSGGALTVLASGSGTNCELGNQDVSGVSFVVTGSATRATVGCSITKAGWLNKTSTTLSATSKSASPVIYFLNGVTLTTPASGERVFKVTVPNGSSAITFTFHVDSSGNVTVTES